MFRKFFLALLTAACLAYAALVGYVYAVQDRLAFYPLSEHSQTPADFGLAPENHTVGTADGERLDAWFFSAGSDSYVLLYSHGNAGNLSHNLASVRQLRRLGLSVFIYDYRGYGRSTGHPDEAGLYRDAEAAYLYLRESLGVPAERVILFGRSLGGALAVHLAVREPARALILESTFTSAVDLGAELYWYLPVSLLARNRFESLRRLSATELKDPDGAPVPLLVIHGRQDRLIPFAHGRRLYQAARTTRKNLLEIKGGHNDGFLVSKRDYEAAFVEFIRGLAPSNASDANRESNQ
ncbi:MAG: alpha/beta hydrolase [Leptospirales bacterium]